MVYPNWNSSTVYTAGNTVYYAPNAGVYIALQTSLNQIPPSSPTFWYPSGSPGSGVLGVNAGTSITVTGTPTQPIVNVSSACNNPASADQNMRNRNIWSVGTISAGNGLITGVTTNSVSFPGTTNFNLAPASGADNTIRLNGPGGVGYPYDSRFNPPLNISTIFTPNWISAPIANLSGVLASYVSAPYVSCARLDVSGGTTLFGPLTKNSNDPIVLNGTMTVNGAGTFFAAYEFPGTHVGISSLNVSSATGRYFSAAVGVISSLTTSEIVVPNATFSTVTTGVLNASTANIVVAPYVVTVGATVGDIPENGFVYRFPNNANNIGYTSNDLPADGTKFTMYQPISLTSGANTFSTLQGFGGCLNGYVVGSGGSVSSYVGTLSATVMNFNCDSNTASWADITYCNNAYQFSGYGNITIA